MTSKFALFYDTETNGLPLFSEPSEHPAQPHIVQLGACLVNLETRQTVSSLDVIIRPDGWEIPAEVAAIHGITTEYAQDVGVPESQAVDLFLAMWYGGRERIAHNEQFDARILRIAIKRHMDPKIPAHLAPLSDVWKAGTARCTQKLATPILKLPPTEKMRNAGRFHNKSANLSEAYEFFTGRKLQNAHSAMADVRGCMAVFFSIQDRLAAAEAVKVGAQ